MENPPSDDRLKGLSEKYAVPENCSKLQVSLINKELWTAFKGKREADLALQTVQKYVSFAMVSTIKGLERE